MKNLLKFLFVAFAFSAVLVSCDDDDDMQMRSAEFEYKFHNGQTVSSAPYDGTHNSDFSATLKVDEIADNKSSITVTLMNTIDGANYMIHAHDAADASTTPNGTPYNETPNGDVLVTSVVGNGGTATVTVESNSSFTFITEEYQGFFVIHDPQQQISTVDISTYLVGGGFARTQTDANLSSSQYTYSSNQGQLNPAFAYSGTHTTDIQAVVTIDELVGGNSRVTVELVNSIGGEMYAVHTHDMADPTTTPNGTPYLETPNANVFASMISSVNGRAVGSNISSSSYTELTTSYEAFLVVHDPLQAITTIDPTTYIILGVFASN